MFGSCILANMRLGLLTLSVFVVMACKPEAQICSPLINNQNPNQVIIDKGDCDGVGFSVELSLTAKQQIQGLMNRTSMPEEAGMLFIFNQEKERGFWMKNTLIPLDMIFIKKNGVIHKVHSNAKPNDLTSIKSDGPVIAVLEINGGLSQQLGIDAGDIVHHPFFQQSDTQ